MDAFAEAAARAAGAGTPGTSLGHPLEVSHPTDAAQMPVVVDPQTGEVYENPADLPSDRLAELAYRLRQAEAERKLWRKAVEEELRGRLARENRREAIVGDYQLAVRGGRVRRWDADDLEAGVQGLIDAGVLAAGEVAELITREAKVNGTLARQLLERLAGAPHDVIAACFTWEERAPGLAIEPAAALPPGP